MRRSTPRTIGDRTIGGVKRGTVEKTDETKKWRTADVRVMHGEYPTEVEHVETYGLTSRPKKPSGSGQSRQAAEAVIVYQGGNASHPLVIMVGDRRYRFKVNEEGEVALYDDQGQVVHLRRDRIHIKAPKGKRVETEVGNAILTVEDGKIIGVVDKGNLFVSDKDHVAIKRRGKTDLHVTVDYKGNRIVSGMPITVVPDPYPQD